MVLVFTRIEIVMIIYCCTLALLQQIAEDPLVIQCTCHVNGQPSARVCSNLECSFSAMYLVFKN